MSLSLNKDVSIRTINNESFIYDRVTSEVHTLNKTGSLILNLLSKGIEIDDIIKCVNEKFEVALENAEKDTKAFISELKLKKVIIESDQSDSK